MGNVVIDVNSIASLGLTYQEMLSEDPILGDYFDEDKCWVVTL